MSAESDQDLTYIMDSFKDVVHDELQNLPAMKGTPMQVALKNKHEIIPYRILRSRPIPVHIEDQAMKAKCQVNQQAHVSQWR